MKSPLGRLERVNLRTAWKHEAGDFTPWLAQDENLQLLADSLGLPELEMVATEHPVGDFKVDILCSDDAGEVIIENQLEKTNHTHLGQIITYAAGVGAKKVVWVAESFRPEHVAALEFLNQNTTGDLNFFAVEVELWRIADSPMAPSFNVVVKPNDWSKAGRESARVAATATPTKLLQQQFWTALVQHIEANKVPVRPQKPAPQHWLNSNPLGRSGFHVVSTVNARENRLGAEVYISHAQSKELFQKLLGQRQAIEQELGFPLDWQELPERHACRILVLRPDSDLADESSWTTYCQWLSEKVDRLSTVFKPRVKHL
ncbi:MAG: hypothetical protein RJA34_583 [Pseudomonadota bacterium]|jgi:hypothetical protein